MNWLRELSEEEIKKCLEGDMELVYNLCGLDFVITLWEQFSGTNIYVSTKPLRSLQRSYVKKYFTGNNIKEIAQKLRVSEKFVYNVISEVVDDKNQDRE